MGAFTMKNYFRIRAGRHVIGEVRGTTFIKKIRASQHFLKTPPAIAFDLDSLAQAERAGAVEVQVIDKETGTIYRTTIAHILRAGFELDRGFGKQIALPLEGWSRQRKGELVQLSLFR
jgi:hypothetical protein